MYVSHLISLCLTRPQVSESASLNTRYSLDCKPQFLCLLHTAELSVLSSFVQTIPRALLELNFSRASSGLSSPAFPLVLSSRRLRILFDAFHRHQSRLQ
jgi:hypothetical protein